ncbi:hypothetical protein ACGFIP_32130 [Micromonospora zamorensis]|uniref:hypothetical protein n=1 Tax=Micromonospora zamorensis TaxID=709883 RepID=UPI00371BEA01
MTSTTGESRRRDSGEQLRDIDGDTGQLQLPPSSAAGVYAAPSPPLWPVSGMLAACMCVAAVFVAGVVVLTVAEEVRHAPVISNTAMHLLTGAAATSWMAVVIVFCRDRLVVVIRALRGSNETMQNRQLELYRRQDHLYGRFNDLANRQAEQMVVLRGIADDVAAIRRDIDDVIGVADADAELMLRQAVNGTRPQTAAGLYVVPPEAQN